LVSKKSNDLQFETEEVLLSSYCDYCEI